MSSAIPMRVANSLIACLPQKERNSILSHCETIHLHYGTVLCEPDQPFQYVYFPLTCFTLLVEAIAGHPPIGMAVVGSEGMLGITLVLGINTAPLRAAVQGAGSALRIDAAQLKRAMNESPFLLHTLHRYFYTSMAHLAQNAACIGFHGVEERLARWLLMAHDCVSADHFYFTHQYLADMLGVQRSAVTIAAGALQKRLLIHYTRGNIYVLDREGLEAASCPCYLAMIDDHTALFSKNHT